MMLGFLNYRETFTNLTVRLFGGGNFLRMRVRANSVRNVLIEMTHVSRSSDSDQVILVISVLVAQNKITDDERIMSSYF
jgi:hypothetical protein